ncbi:response regulator [Neorhizobium galegae]|uniref:response regulator n=1 Tax=Neorhizobium galegae TaxID=399 RepID=UPI0006218CCE|nr:response regulator [Neorhizobium galegae]KAB1124677.1 response regulator [Neorhizobium galegae]MCQ1806473.1 response regulator [Neorhizobium galegae]CDZ58134.1 Response regulator receiver domain protein,histidine kinase [Neorhizobium galegae bv. orientalis]
MNQTRPALLLVTASLIPLIILAAVMGRFFIQEQQNALDADIRSKATIMAATLQRELKSQIQLLSVVADSPRLDPPIPRSAFAETARRLRERVPEWEQIRISDEKGEVVLSSPALEGSAEKQVVDVESHRTLVRTGAAVIGNVSIGPRGQAAFAVRVPIERNDKLRAILSVVIRPTIVTNLLYANGLPESWAAWIVDGQDRLVASTGAPALAGNAASEFASFTGTDGLATLKNGLEVRVAEVALGETPWRVRVGLPVAEYDRLARKATLLLAAASCFTLLLSGSAAFLFHREIRARNRERESIANWQRMDALGKLTGQAAHDFNNLLMVFQSGVEGIKRRRNDEQRVTQLLSHMSEGVTRGKAITQRLLSFSRRSNQGAGHVELDIKLPELRPLLRQAIDDTIVMDINVPDDIWPVHVDPAGLENALINFLTNAREAMGGGGQVTISARNVLDGAAEDPTLQGQFVAVTIADTGTGVASEHLGRVFEPFFSTKKNGGPGLGLTQVHSFAKGSGGAVKVASVAGHGSAFTLLLPRSNEQRVAREPARPAVNLPARLLIVDDTPSSLESVRLALEGLVSTIFVATSGSEAIEVLERHPDIEAVISDIMMPGMSGIELAEEIRRKNSRLPVVLMTGYSDKLEAGTEVGCPVVAKPFKIEDLAASLEAAKTSTEQSANVVRLEILAKS